MRIADLAGRRVALLGFGVEGRATLAAIRSRLADQPVTVPARLSGDDAFAVLELGLKPNLTLAEMRRRGVEPVEELPDAMNAGLFSLDGKEAQEHWLALNNFYVITRYNRSKNYAMAVYQLSREIARAHAQAASIGQSAQSTQ